MMNKQTIAVNEEHAIIMLGIMPTNLLTAYIATVRQITLMVNQQSELMALSRSCNVETKSGGREGQSQDTGQLRMVHPDDLVVVSEA